MVQKYRSRSTFFFFFLPQSHENEIYDHLISRSNYHFIIAISDTPTIRLCNRSNYSKVRRSFDVGVKAHEYQIVIGVGGNVIVCACVCVGELAHFTAESGNVHIVLCKVNEATRKLSHEYESGTSCLCASPIYI